MDDYVSKPIQAGELAAAVERWIAGRAQTKKGEKRSKVKKKTAIFDRADLLRRVDGDEDFLAELVSLFLQDITRQLDILARALANGDAALCSRQAHFIKGSSAILGADAILKVASELETASKGGDMKGATDLFEKLKEEFEALRMAFADLDIAQQEAQQLWERIIQ